LNIYVTITRANCQPSPTLYLGGHSLAETSGNAGVFNGQIREARLWSSVLTSREVANSDCTYSTPLLRFSWSASASSGDGCPVGDYCQTWLSPATCNVRIDILCGTTAAVTSISSDGTFTGATWVLVDGVSEIDDWPIQLFDGSTYWQRLVYGTDLGPCTDYPSCSMAENKYLSLPTPPFRYMAGLKQTHIGTSCTDATAVARVMLNAHECLMWNSTAWSASVGSTYAPNDIWDCQSAFVGQGIQESQQLSQAATVTCSSPSTGPGLTIGSGDSYVYVQN
jgi:hypothetical protein